MVRRRWPVSQMRLFDYFWMVDQGVSACSLQLAPHVKTLSGSSVRARSATGQVTKSLGKKTELRHQRDRSSCEHVSAEDIEANRVGRQDGAFRAQDRSG